MRRRTDERAVVLMVKHFLYGDNIGSVCIRRPDGGHDRDQYLDRKKRCDLAHRPDAVYLRAP
jgi:hypothetical protein